VQPCTITTRPQRAEGGCRNRLERKSYKSARPVPSTADSSSHVFPIETGIRDRVRDLIEEMICAELDAGCLAPAMAGERSLQRAAALLEAADALIAGT
jgi:hypothetical protein